ncbi:DNA polymerase III, tau subunit [Paludibacter propionicigenes WB4]|uniref:DNA polymerase III subunit gamma/tau n=1 Tax=Paludibacter propionicigenes (strain DSM 17365 / JCM 13257 / WB4) TaxID=694427 RepID=E4T0E5_PALPW|nr:DNA polymerase III subunit gamma/tau [Paludibacter propionicigenes]ADQ78304.1 DNA polymerase III, tau subunit [Paludibacter propionicigenes WB4]
MENFIVSARKYRPSTFNSVVGQSSLTVTLKNAIKSNHLAHAYLFCGPRGVGKTTCARIFAKTINCQNLTSDFEACNECESCVSFNEQRSYNIHELDAASNNGVDDIRSLTDQVRIPPQIGKYSVYIIDEVHMLSQGAFNAFLKTLEEPPAHAIFILATTEKHKIIPTILSRCQIYDFNRITVADTVKHLQMVAEKEGVTVDVNGLNVVAQKSDGGMRDALSIFDQLVSFCGNNITYQGVIENLNVLDYEYYFKLVEAFLKGDVSQSLLLFNEVLNKGFDAHHFITGLSSHLRDVLVSKDPQTISLLEVGADIGERYKTQAQNCSPDFLFQALKISNDCDIDYRQSKNKRLLVELALIRLCQLTDEKKKSILTDEKPAPIQKIQVAATSEPTVAQPVVNKVTTPVQTAPPVTRPVITPKPKDVVADSKPSFVRPGSISITAPGKSNIEQQTAANETVNEAPSSVLNKDFSEEALLQAWQQFAETIPEQGRMTSLFLSTYPKMTSKTTFEITVSNILQEKELKRLQQDIQSFIHARLENSHVKMTIKVMEETAVQRATSPEDRYRIMAEQNPALDILKNGLQLEID